MKEDALLRKMQEARESWLDLVGDKQGRRIKVRLPLQTQFMRVLRMPPEEMVATVAVGWEGVTEACLLGAGIGASDEVPFTPALAVQWLCDDPENVGLLVGHVAKLVEARLKLAAEDEKK